MRFRTDDRGVTVQVGTVLLFGILIILLSMYQASVVPQQNEEVEFNHNQRVQGQLQELRDELHRTAVTGSGGSASVALGTLYPSRAFFVNPAPPSGRLETTDPATVTIGNAEAAGETGDYWDGSDRDFSTRGIVYDPGYNVYDNSPTTVYRNGILYNRFDSATQVLAGQQLVQDNRISLVAVDGELSESSTGTASVDLQAVSAATRTVTVANADSNGITLTVPTELGVDDWEDLLESELDPEGDDPDKHVAAVEDAGTDRIRVVLESGTYELRMAKVGVGRDATDVGPHYVTVVRGDRTSVPTNGRQKVVVEVRDRFNNPVAGVEVERGSVSGGSVTPEQVRTDARGRATFVYNAPASAGRETMTVQIADSPDDREEATVELNVNTGGSTGGGGSDGGGRTVTYADEYDDWLSDVDANGKEIGVPPLTPYGQIDSFENLRNDEGSRATLSKEQVSSSPPEGELSLGIAVDDIPSAGSYTLELEYQRTGGEVYTVTPVDLNGDAVGDTHQLSGSGRTTTSISLSTSATEYVERTGELYLQVEDTTTQNSPELRLYYVRVRAES